MTVGPKDFAASNAARTAEKTDSSSPGAKVLRRPTVTSAATAPSHEGSQRSRRTSHRRMAIWRNVSQANLEGNDNRRSLTDLADLLDRLDRYQQAQTPDSAQATAA